MNLLQLHEPGETPLPHEGDETAAVGIDLGTTHSLVAYSHDGQAEVLTDAHGHSLVPSVVHYTGCATLVGKEAKEARQSGAKDAVASIKRLMGRGAEDIRPLLGRLPYDIVEGEGGMVKIRAGERILSPVEVSADILLHLKRMAEHALGKQVTQAVITVPAYFDDAARAATRDAARLAGLTVLRLLAEPTAAALAYGLDKGAEGIYAIYDLGGGTFDLSLLKLSGGVFQVLATGGDTALGGDDFDQKVAEFAAMEMGLKNLSMEQMGVLLSKARTAKEELTDKDETKIEFEGKRAILRRTAFESMIDPLIGRTTGISQRVIQDAGITREDIKGVVLVGGSTRTPVVRKRVKECFGKEPLVDVNPDQVVAVGAARQAEGLTHGSDMLLLDVVPLSLGLETMGGMFEKLIQRNTPIPTSVAQQFTTYQDGQTGMHFHILQGEREMVNQNRSLARFELKGIPPLPAGVARIQVNFTVDADGLLTVSAEEETTKIRQTVEVRPSYGLPPEEIERMLLDSMRFAKEDITERLLAEARMEAERAILELLSAMEQDAQLLTDAEKTLIGHQVNYLRQAAESGDRDRIDVEMQQLSHVAAPFAQRRMDNAIASALKGAHVKDVLAGENHA